ncbi:MAG: helix-hairpin-helix domain-containing protein [Methanobacteriales archaeon]|nr:helix-hairpin-helix domain-containing protein [Methanobacteriales archaeon]
MLERKRKLQILSDSAQFDLCDYSADEKQRNVNLPGIYYSSMKGCKVPLFKVLLSNKCYNDCKYCLNCSKREFTRIELEPDELSKVFMDYYEKRYVEGLFLSSATIDDVDNTMEKLVEVVRILRHDKGYDGYIHLKILPGTSKELIKRAMELSNRVSINIETATADGLSALSSTKDYKIDIIRRMKWIKKIHDKNPDLTPSGQSTQFIVGAVEETDQEILKRISWLYDKLNIKRTYFSSFQALDGTPLEDKPEPDPRRSIRLYQADALVKSYNFKLSEFEFNEGFLDLEMDPKYVAALKSDLFPLDINTATYDELIRVPGIGPISARRIISKRRKSRINSLDELKGMGVWVKRAGKFLYIDGYQSNLDNFQ